MFGGGPADSGYLIFERAGATLRVLEVVGSETACKVLWRSVLLQARKLGIKQIRGWESGIRELYPRFHPGAVMPEEPHTLNVLEPARFMERYWGRAMILCLNRKLNGWRFIYPCPLLELDLF